MHKSPGDIFVLTSLVFAAVCMNLSWTHTYHDADSLMMSLISIDRYLPFYWGDNRYGMLVPWLAQWVRDYRWNMLFQAQLHALAPVALVAIFTRWFLRRNLAVAALTLAIAIPLFRPDARVVLPQLMGAPYHTSMLLGLLAVALILRIQGPLTLRFAIAAPLMLLSFWVNFSTVFFVAGLLLFLPEERTTWRIRAAAVVLSLSAFLAVRWFASAYPQLGHVGLVAPAVAWKSTLNLTYMSFTHVLFPARVALLCLVAFLVGRKTLLARSDSQVFFFLAAAFALAVACTDWVVQNLWEPRYWTSAITIAVLVFASPVAIFIHDRLPRAQSSIAAIVLAAVSLAIFGVPSTSRALDGIDQSAGVRWKEVQALGCTHMLGFFSQAWSSVYFAKAHNLPRPRFAIAPRAEVLGEDWRKTPPADRVYCGLCGHPATTTAQVQFGIGHLDTVQTMGELCRYAHPSQ